MSSFPWLVRRELWESRAIWIAPAIVAAVVIGSLLLVAAFAPQGALVIDGQQAAALSAKLTPQKIEALAGMVHASIGLLFLISVLFTQYFYTLDSLYTERRDRSILFWKSMPVSDAETVLSKLFVAAVLIPAVAAAAAVLTLVVSIGIVSGKLASMTLLAGHFWTLSTWAGSLGVFIYVLIASTLWYLPWLGWLLLVSAWAPRSPVMWSLLPPLAVSLAEAVIFHTTYFLHLLGERAGFTGLAREAFSPLHGVTGNGYGAIVVDSDRFEVTVPPIDLIRPWHFITSTEVLVGIAVGVGLVLAAIALRRYRDENS